MSRRAVREAGREAIPMWMLRDAYEDPDGVRASEHDELREIRSRWFGDEGVELVVDGEDGRIVTV